MELELALLSPEDGRTLWSERLVRTEGDRGFAGMGGNTAPMTRWLSAVVEELLEEAFSESAFLSAAGG